MKQTVISRRLYNLLMRARAGDCPRATAKEYYALLALPYLHNALQYESAAAADTRDGFIITPLHDGKDQNAKIDKLLAEYKLVDESGDEHKRRPTDRPAD